MISIGMEIADFSGIRSAVGEQTGRLGQCVKTHSRGSGGCVSCLAPDGSVDACSVAGVRPVDFELLDQTAQLGGVRPIVVTLSEYR